MKLLVIMSVEAYAPELRRLYVQHGLTVFSETDVEGYHRPDPDAHRTSWFGHDRGADYSKLTFALVPDDQADALLDALAAYNRDVHPERPAHAFLMGVERTV